LTPRMWSLLEIMRQFDTWRFAEIVHELSKWYWIAVKRSADGDIDPTVVEEIKDLVGRYHKHCEYLQLRASVARIEGPLHDALVAYGAITWDALKSEFRVLWDALGPELSDRRFVAVTESKAKLLDAMEPPSNLDYRGREKDHIIIEPNHWKVIWTEFPPAKRDVQEAVYCYVLERDTATVFHAMRVAEHGLRSLARRLHVALTHKGRHQPIEFADWEKVIDGIKVKIAASRQLSKGPKQVRKLELYSDMADHCVFMKDIWRNNVSHARKPYKSSEALSVLERVRDFMLFLAKNFR
jgi:hypothetical protein